MRALKRLLLGMLLLLLVMAAVAYALPSTVLVQRSMVINAPEQDIFPYLNDFRKINEWSPRAARDPGMRFEFSGQPQGVGARMQWSSDHADVGQGAQEIVESEPGKLVVVNIAFDEGAPASARYELTPAGAGTKVTWRRTAEVGNNPLARWMGLRRALRGDDDSDQGLARLKELVEKGNAPN